MMRSFFSTSKSPSLFASGRKLSKMESTFCPPASWKPPAVISSPPVSIRSSTTARSVIASPACPSPPGAFVTSLSVRTVSTSDSGSSPPLHEVKTQTAETAIIRTMARQYIIYLIFLFSVSALSRTETLCQVSGRASTYRKRICYCRCRPDNPRRALYSLSPA